MMHPDLEGYRAMTNELRQDPVALYKMLRARRADLLDVKSKTSHVSTARMVDEALVEIDAALAKTVEKLNKLAAAEAEEAEAGEALSEEFSIPEDAPPVGETEETEAVEQDVEAPDEATFDADPAPDDVAEEEALAEDEAPVEDEAPEPEAAEPEPSEPQNPVAMSSKLRKAIGDTSADLLDDYALKVHKSVVTFFENLTKKALDLGTEDASDSSNSLREVLLSEVGKRGLASVESNFLDWREALIKKLWKDVSAMFAVPETEEEASSDFQVDVPPTPDTVEPPPVEEAPPAEPVAVATEPVPQAIAPVGASVGVETIRVAQGPVSFVKGAAGVGSAFSVHPDLKPAGMKSIKLT